MSEAELLDRWRDGDEAAGAELLERSFPRLYRFFRGKTDADVRDLIQQTLLRCVADRDRFRGEARFSTFVFAIARIVLLEHLRARRRQFDPLQTSAIDISPSLSEVAASDELRVRLHEALRRIPIDLQTIVELHYWEGLPGAAAGGGPGDPRRHRAQPPTACQGCPRAGDGLGVGRSGRGVAAGNAARRSGKMKIDGDRLRPR